MTVPTPILSPYRTHDPNAFRALVNLGEVHWRRGRGDAARRQWAESLMRVRLERRQQSSIVPALITLGRHARESNDARMCLVDGLPLLREARRWALPHGFEVVVEIAADEGQLELVLQVAGAAAALRDRMLSQPWPSARARLEAAIGRARQNLTEDVADVAWMQGWSRPVDETMARALEFLRASSTAHADSQPPATLTAASSGP